MKTFTKLIFIGIIFIIHITSTSFAQSALYGFIGRPRSFIISLMDTSNYSYSPSGSFFLIEYVLKSDSSDLKKISFNFDKTVPSYNTPCTAVSLYYPVIKAGLLKKKMLSDNPVADTISWTFSNDFYHAKLNTSEEYVILKLSYEE